MLRTLVLALALAACGMDPTPAVATPEELRSEKPRDTSPEIAPADLAAQVAGNTDFALAMLELVNSDSENVFFSPHSIEVALAMTWAGARGETEAAMASALRFVLPQAELHAAFNALDLALASRGEGAAGADGEGFRLRVLNAVFAQDGFAILAAFLDVLAESYGAGVRVLDFVADAAGATAAINAWVEGVTEGRIAELIPPGALGPATKLVLVNAVYFNAAWAYPFEETMTADAVFHGAAGDVTAPMMHLPALETAYYEGEGFTAVVVPYDGEELEMLVFLPEAAAGFVLDAALLDAVRGGMSHGLVELEMPRFEVKGETVSLKQVLSDLGMGVAFTPAADLSGIDGVPGALMIHDVLHQAFVKVNEAGTEAAAATAVIVGDTSAPPPGPRIVLDRPFTFLILDRPTGQILFIGRINAL